MSRKLYTIEETRAEAGSLGGAGHERMELLVTPFSPDEARNRFECTVYSCSLSGQDCARRSIKSRTGDSAPGGMLACRVCPAGAARARLLDPDYAPDPMDGRRPTVGRNQAWKPRKRRPPAPSEVQAVAAAPTPPPAPPPKPAKAPARTRKAKGPRRPSQPRPPCEACGKPLGISRRPALHPLRPYCADCVGRATRRLSHHIQGGTPEDVRALVLGRPIEEVRDQIAARGGKPLRPKAVVGACAKCGRARLYSKREPGHPLRPYCTACCRDAGGRLKNDVRAVLSGSPAAVALFIESGDREAAVAQALADGCAPIGRHGALLGTLEDSAAPSPLDPAAGGEGGSPPGPLPPAATLVRRRIQSAAPPAAPPLPSDLAPPGAGGGEGPAGPSGLRGARAVEARRLLDELVADRTADRARIAGLEAQVRHLVLALAAGSGLVGVDEPAVEPPRG